MRPIEYRTDMDFRQALRCVEYRIGPLRSLPPRTFLLALGLRYGLVGTAAIHHLLDAAAPDEERSVIESSIGWSQVVADHVRHQVMHHLPWDVEAQAPELIGRLAQLPVDTAMPLVRRSGPLPLALGLSIEEFVETHRRDIRQGWGWFRGRQREREFCDLAEASQFFALHFHERRSYDLDEVREIALLGE